MEDVNAIEELAYIKKIIADSRRSFIDNGVAYIIWGILVVFGLLNTFAAIKFSFAFPIGITWALLIAAGWIYSIYQEVKYHKLRKGMNTLTGKIMQSLWFGTGVTMTIFGFLGTIANAYGSGYITALISATLAIPYIVTGVIYDSKLMKYSAIGWWGGAIYMFFNPNVYSLLLMAALMIFLQVIPGIYLYKTYKAENWTD